MCMHVACVCRVWVLAILAPVVAAKDNIKPSPKNTEMNPGPHI